MSLNPGTNTRVIHQSCVCVRLCACVWSAVSALSSPALIHQPPEEWSDALWHKRPLYLLHRNGKREREWCDRAGEICAHRTAAPCTVPRLTHIYIVIVISVALWHDNWFQTFPRGAVWEIMSGKSPTSKWASWCFKLARAARLLEYKYLIKKKSRNTRGWGWIKCQLGKTRAFFLGKKGQHQGQS